jgi:hypothetical protein
MFPHRFLRRASDRHRRRLLAAGQDGLPEGVSLTPLMDAVGE